MRQPALFGRPFIDLGRYIGVGVLRALDDEICGGLPRVTVDNTGGGHSWMGIVPPSALATGASMTAM